MDTFQLIALARQAANRLPFQPDPCIYVFRWGGGGVYSQITWGIHLITQCLKTGRWLYLQRAEFSRAIIWWQIRGKKRKLIIHLPELWSPNNFDCILLSLKKNLSSHPRYMLIYFLINYLQAVPISHKETAGVEELVTATVICPSHNTHLVLAHLTGSYASTTIKYCRATFR